MIRIVKPMAAPTYFLRRGVKQTKLDCDSFDLCPDEYLSGNVRFPTFKNTIFNAKQVKKVLLKAQHNKCCYCESKYPEPINLAVEHFRPKSAVKQTHGDKEEYPGYYWLAYEWNNLLLSCHPCNSIHKRTLFPLANPRRRARSHHSNIHLERPLFVHPTQQNPRDHIRFEDDAPQGLTLIGQTTIEGTGLRRDSLREKRLEKLRLLETFLKIVECAKATPRNRKLQALAGDALEFLETALLPDAEYSSMAQDFILKRQA